MTHPLQDKDAQWRNRGHAARPVFDPGAAPLGVDEEAGGAASSVPAEAGPSEPLPLDPDPGSHGLRAPPRVWYGLAAAMTLVLLVAGALSLLGG